MVTIKDIVISSTPPNTKYVAWVKPIGDNIELYLSINGKWITTKASEITISKASTDDVLVGTNDDNYITPLGLKVIRDQINSYIIQSVAASLNASQAYVDSLVKSYESINLYITSTNIVTTKPIGAGQSVNYNLTTTEKLLFSKTYTTTASGIVDKNNLYNISIPFDSISSSRTTYIRMVWRLGNTVIFDKRNVLDNSNALYNFEMNIINELTTDTPYAVGTVFTLDVYSYVSNGTDTISILFGDKDRTFSLVRNAPIATLAASKIESIFNGSSMNQQQINEYLLSEINKLKP